MVVQGIIGFQDECYVLLDREHGRVIALQIGQAFEVLIGGRWQAVTLKGGGYRGRYIETSDGQRSRLALCMRARVDTSPSVPGVMGRLAPATQGDQVCALARYTPHATPARQAVTRSQSNGLRDHACQRSHTHIRSRGGVVWLPTMTRPARSHVRRVGPHVSRSDVLSSQASQGRLLGKPRPSKYISSSIGSPCSSFFDRYLSGKPYLSKCITSPVLSWLCASRMASHVALWPLLPDWLFVPVVRQSQRLNADFSR